jgi:hypothetical protein
MCCAAASTACLYLGVNNVFVMFLQLHLPLLPVYEGSSASLQLCFAASAALFEALLGAISGGDPAVSFAADSGGMVRLLDSAVQPDIPTPGGQRHVQADLCQGLRELFSVHLWQPAVDFGKSIRSGYVSLICG